jgi:hypothetical protein
MYPKFVANTWRVWSNGHALNAAARRLLFYDETYPILLFLRKNTPPGAVVILPPRAFVKSQVASRRAPGEDLVPLLGTSSSAYGVLYPRIPVMFDDASPWKEKATHLLVWDWWGLDLVDSSIPRTEANRLRLFEAPSGTGAAPAPLPRIRQQTADDCTGPDRWITPALFLGLLILAAFGDGMYRLLGRMRLRPRTAGSVEWIAWRMLLALAIVPWLAVSYDLAGIPFTRGSMTAAAVAVLVAGFAAQRPGFRRGRSVLVEAPRGGPAAAAAVVGAAAVVVGAPAADPATRRTPDPIGLFRSPAALVLIVATGTIVLGSLVQVAILPERNYDAIVGYDLVGKILAAEGKLRSSIFDRIVYNAQSVYAPFTSTNNGFGYLFFEAVPRLWVPWLLVGFLLAFGSWVRRRTGSATLAALATFLVLLPQALLTQGATEARPDLPSMVYTAFAALVVIDLFRGRGGYGAPTVLILVATTARTENILFGVALAAACFLVRPSPPGRWRVVGMVLVPTAFFLFWNLAFVKGLIGYDPAAHFRRLDFAPDRVIEIVRRAFAIMAWPQAFGEFIVVVVAGPLAWSAWRLARRRARGDEDRPGALEGPGTAAGATQDPAGEEPVSAGTTPAAPTDDVSGKLLLLAGLMFVFYLAFFYAWDPELNPLWTMIDTFKRGFFRFVPLLLVALLALPPLAGWLRRCDGVVVPGASALPASADRVGDTT